MYAIIFVTMPVWLIPVLVFTICLGLLNPNRKSKYNPPKAELAFCKVCDEDSLSSYLTQFSFLENPRFKYAKRLYNRYSSIKSAKLIAQQRQTIRKEAARLSNATKNQDKKDARHINFNAIAENIWKFGKFVAAVAFCGFALYTAGDKFGLINSDEHELKVIHVDVKKDDNTASPAKKPSTVSSTPTGYTEPTEHHDYRQNVLEQSATDESTQWDNSRWEQFYSNQYTEMERQAENSYNSLISSGFEYNKDGNHVGGVGRRDPYVASQIVDYENIQRRMKNLRNEASQKGVTIMPSKWETIEVHSSFH